MIIDCQTIVNAKWRNVGITQDVEADFSDEKNALMRMSTIGFQNSRNKKLTGWQVGRLSAATHKTASTT